MLLLNISKTYSDSDYWETNLRVLPTPCISSKWLKNSMQFTLGMPFLGVLGKFYRNRKGLILGGDLNFVMCPRLDRSSKKVISPSKSATIIQSFLRNYGICDSFRFLNPSTRKFSFFSQVHQSYSRIDYIFLDNKLLPYLQGVNFPKAPQRIISGPLTPVY